MLIQTRPRIVIREKIAAIRTVTTAAALDVQFVASPDSQSRFETRAFMDGRAHKFKS